ncbi:MAG: hypothetical protein R3B90_07340 [Planctomycetaceae bacterium]
MTLRGIISEEFQADSFARPDRIACHEALEFEAMLRYLIGSLLSPTLLFTLILSASADDSRKQPDPAVVKALSEAGGNVLELAQNDPRLDVSLHLASQEITNDHLTLVARLPDVVWLNLAGTKITDDGLAAIAEMKSLEKLHLEKTGIGDAGLAHLTKLENLAYLNLYGTQVTDAGLQHLTGLTKLRRLYVWQSQVTPEGIAKLKETLPELTIVGELSLQPAPSAVEPAKSE